MISPDSSDYSSIFYFLKIQDVIDELQIKERKMSIAVFVAVLLYTLLQGIILCIVFLLYRM